MNSYYKKLRKIISKIKKRLFNKIIVNMSANLQICFYNLFITCDYFGMKIFLFTIAFL